MIVLLDASVLIACVDDVHLIHRDAWTALDRLPNDAKIATCAITQLALLRYLMRFHESLCIDHAIALLSAVTRGPRHLFLKQEVEPAHGRWFGVIGHAQVTDAYLADIARANGAKLLTADRGMAALHHDVAELI